MYVDIHASKREHLQDLEERPPIGFEKVYEREIFNSDIAASRYVPTSISLTEEEMENLHELERWAKPFGYWSVWKHKESDLAFSLFYLGGEAYAVFQGLYVQNKEYPLYLAIIQPGHGDGVMGWEEVHNDNCHFHDLVMNNPAGTPEYIIWGHEDHNAWSYMERNYWSDYDGEHIAHLPNRCATVYRLKHRR